MDKFILSTLVILASGGYALSQYLGGASMTVVNAPSTSPIAVTETTPAPALSATTPQPVKNPTVTPVTTPVPAKPVSTPIAATPAPAPKPKGQYIDGAYTGSQADAYYGTVQVKATISGGKLVSVEFLQYPNDRRTSQYINSQAMPLLQSEAIQAQSANVNGVSGASDTSAAFIQSLGDALSKAKA
jgi:uncharacterized protein with FMN-binding domain